MASLVGVMCAVLLVACGGEAERPSPAAAPAEREASSLTGTLRGVVRFAGESIPGPVLVENTTDPEVCGFLQSREEILVSPQGRGIANVIVSLRDPPSGFTVASSPNHLVLDNRDCRFVPHVAVLTVGDTIEIVSHDPVLHTVHFYGALERNIALPDPRATATVAVRMSGTIAVLCDLHGWMKAFIRVEPHPFHSVSDAEGSFVLQDIPSGSHQLDVWHEILGTRSVRVHIEPGATAEIEVMLGLDDP